MMPSHMEFVAINEYLTEPFVVTDTCSYYCKFCMLMKSKKPKNCNISEGRVAII